MFKKTNLKILIVVFFLIFLVFLVLKECRPLAKGDVVEVVKMWMVANKSIGSEAIIKSINFDGKWWIVEIADRGCLILLTVGDCGDIDVGGVSSECRLRSPL